MRSGLLKVKHSKANTVASPQPVSAPPAPPVQEADLIRAAQTGERSAQATLVERYWDRIYRWLYRLTHNAHVAEDLTQDTFLKALAHLRRFQADTNFAAWLF